MAGAVDPASDEALREAEDGQGRLAEGLEASLLVTAARAAAGSLDGARSTEMDNALWAAEGLGLFEAWRQAAADRAAADVGACAEANDEAWAAARFAEAGVVARGWDEVASVSAVVSERARAGREAVASVGWGDVSLRLASGESVPAGSAVAEVVASVPAGVGTAEGAAHVARQLSEAGAVRVEVGGRSYELSGWARRQAWAGWATGTYAMRQALGRELGMDAVEVSAHACCAEDHLPYQGRVYATREFERIQADLPRPIMSWNCRHTISPCWSDSTPTHGRAELREYERYSTEEVEVSGRTMTRYQATQWQRSQERAVRAWKTRAMVWDASVGEGSAEAAAARRRARELTRAYREGSAAAGLRTDPSRLVVQRLHR